VFEGSGSTKNKEGHGVESLPRATQATAWRLGFPPLWPESAPVGEFVFDPIPSIGGS
jgi:hypothetical protein